MSQEFERVYTIPLGKVLLSANTHRAVRAINMIKEFARRHMKTYEIKIDEEVSHQIWARGVRSPPRKIRVKMTKTDGVLLFYHVNTRFKNWRYLSLLFFWVSRLGIPELKIIYYINLLH